MNKLISCRLHDYIEIACMYGYPVRLTLKDRQLIEGKTIDTCVDAEKREYLIVDNGQKQQIELNQLAKMEVLSTNAVFTEVNF